MFCRRGIGQVFHGNPRGRQGRQIHPVFQVFLAQFPGVGLVHQQDHGIVKGPNPQVPWIPQRRRQPVPRLGFDGLESSLRRQLLEAGRSGQQDVGLGRVAILFARRTRTLSFPSERPLKPSNKAWTKVSSKSL